MRRIADDLGGFVGGECIGKVSKPPLHVLSYIRQKRIFAVQISGKYILPKTALVEFLVTDFAFEIVHKSLWHMNTILGFTEQK